MSPARLAWLDFLRGAALLGMAGFHFTWDLAHFGWLDPDVVAARPFHGLGHGIAGSFLFIAGFSLALARRTRGPLWRSRPFWRRWAEVAGAAAAISAISYVLFPDTPIFFGILHCIAASSLIGLALVEAPAALVLGSALATGAAPLLFAGAFFDAPALWWTGLSTFEPISNDFRPLLPWLGCFLAGLALAKFVPGLAGASSGAKKSNALAFLGRHSLAFYLIHQPLLFGLFMLVGLFVAPEPDEVDFVAQCAAQCAASGVSDDFCANSCRCVVARAKQADYWTALAANQLTPAQRRQTHDDAVACYADEAMKTGK